MIGALALLLATIMAIELLAATGLMGAFGRLSRLGGRSTRLLLRTGVSEWAKERAMRLMALRLLVQSMRTAALLALVAAPIVALLIADARWPLGAREALTDWPLRVLLLVATSAYALWRRRGRRRAARNDGPGGERLLQRIALGSPAVIDMTFDLERRLHGRAAASIPAPAPVFVAGLARAGTTVLMRALHASGDFASLSYRDLPFPLAPNAWARAGQGADRRVAARERGHGDGILHDLDSPEAIEEIFWRHREGGRYRTPEGLIPAPPSDETIDDFGTFARLVLLRYSRPRYLSKNNANVLRLPALLAAFPDAIFVHPFRDPVQQAASLLAQHRRACALAEGDPYRARFMGWMGHHEFGADRRPFLLPGGPGAGDDPSRIDYWLKSWIGVHAFLLAAPPAIGRRQIFIDYDAMIPIAGRIAPVLGEALAMVKAPDLGVLRPPPLHMVRGADASLVAAARAIHRELAARGDTLLKLSEPVRPRRTAG